MNIHDAWEKALKRTEVIRQRVQPLSVIGVTPLPYIFLAESKLNEGDTVVRKGEIMVEKPSIILPNYSPQFEGFELDKDYPEQQNLFASFLLIRGIRFPSFKYNNKTESLDIFEGHLKEAMNRYAQELQKKEDLLTGLVVGPEDVWQFSVMIFICNQVIRQADGDIRKLLDNDQKGL